MPEQLEDETPHRKVPLVHNGRMVGVAEVNPDDNQIVCTFDIKTLMVAEVIDLFWVAPGTRVELNTYVPIGGDLDG